MKKISHLLIHLIMPSSYRASGSPLLAFSNICKSGVMGEPERYRFILRDQERGEGRGQLERSSIWRQSVPLIPQASTVIIT